MQGSPQRHRGHRGSLRSSALRFSVCSVPILKTLPSSVAQDRSGLHTREEKPGRRIHRSPQKAQKGAGPLHARAVGRRPIAAVRRGTPRRGRRRGPDPLPEGGHGRAPDPVALAGPCEGGALLWLLRGAQRLLRPLRPAFSFQHTHGGIRQGSFPANPRFHGLADAAPRPDCSVVKQFSFSNANRARPGRWRASAAARRS